MVVIWILSDVGYVPQIGSYEHRHKKASDNTDLHTGTLCFTTQL